MKKLVQLLIIVLFLSCTSVIVFADNHETEYIIRLYNPNTTEHLYTTNVNEGVALVNIGWKQEQESWLSVKNYGTPVYRLYNSSIDDHLFTSDKNETQVLTQNGWTLDNAGNPVFYSLGKMPVYRLYSPVTRRHHLTVSKIEYDILPTRGWIQEGEGFYGVEPYTIDQTSSSGIYTATFLPFCDDNGIDVNTYEPESGVTAPDPGENVTAPGSTYY